MIKINIKHIILISIVILFFSVSTVNAANTTGNTSLHSTSAANSSSGADNLGMKSSVTTPTSKSSSRFAKEIKITDSTYSNYFNVYNGKILSTADIIAGDALRIGNVTNKMFIIDRRLTITTISDGDQITNGMIHLIAGSDGSIVTGLKIRNNKLVYTVNGISSANLDGIRLTNSSYNTISYNDVELPNSAGVYVMPMDWSNHNTIVYNRLSSGVTVCIPMSESHYNNISYNHLEVRSYMYGVVGNIIYFNPYGNANYGSGLCVGNYISNNYLHSAVISEMIIGMMLTYNSHDNTTVINNTISHFFTGIVLVGNNTVIQGNHIIDDSYDHAITALGSNVLVADNVINLKSVNVGIAGVSGSSDSPVIIRNNTITISEGCSYAISSDNCSVYNNVINLPTYGISIMGVGGLIANNTVTTNKDPAIKINSNNTKIVGNTIKTNSYGIYVLSPDVRIYFNSIVDNSIVSNLYGIYLKGLVYNTTISGNVIRTNASVGIFKDITDDFGDDSSDNTVNDIIYDATAIIVDDSNFYNYFDENGNLKFNSFKKDAVIILTHLTGKNLKFNHKVTLLSNDLPNLLIKVTITLYSGATGSIIKDLNFYNTNSNAIILAQETNNITISGNNITILSDAAFKDSLSGVLVYGPCQFVNITKNNIFINSKQGYIYGVNVVSYDPVTSRFATDFSKNFTITNNSIILIGDKLAEGIYTDSLIYTNIVNNMISVVGGSYGYGVATASVIGSLHDLNITNNTVLVNARGMVYLIELHMSNNVSVVGNYLYGVGSGVYGVCAYHADNVTVKSNVIQTVGGDLSFTDPGSLDVLGKGNAAIFLTANASNINILLNTIYTNAVKQLNFSNAVNVTLSRNGYVVDDGNLLNYFTSRSDGVLRGGLVQANDTLLFADIRKYSSLVLDIPLTLTSYLNGDVVNASFLLRSGASNSTISNLVFDLIGKTAVTLTDASNVKVVNNNIHVSAGSGVAGILIAFNSVSNQIKNNIIDMTGGSSLYGIKVSNFYLNRYGRSPKLNLIQNNSISVKSGYSATGIYVAMADSTSISGNKIVLVSDRIYGVVTDYSVDYLSFGTLRTNNTQIVNNAINGTGGLVYLIESLGALNNVVRDNMLTSTSNTSYGYVGFGSSGDIIEANTILINGTSKFKGDKISTGQTGVYYSSGSQNNHVVDNYIISTYLPGGDYAVYLAGLVYGFNLVDGNYLISDKGNKTANRAVYAPFDVVTNNTPVYIYVSPQGSDLTGDGSKLKPYKSIEYALSQAYNRAVIYLSKGTYHENGLTIDKTIIISIFNGEVALNGDGENIFNISSTGNLTINNINITKGATAFINYGKLAINNSNISHNTATKDGGAILNYGDLSLNNSTLTYNGANSGGAISNYGTALISGCKMNYNSAFRGGVIYNNETDSLKIVNSSFEHNSVVNNGGVIENYGFISVSSSLFKFNNATNGGAIFSDSPEFNIFNSTFSYNEASESGGAISASMDEGTIDRSTFTKNTAVSGGALWLSGGDIKISKSIISNNTAVYYAGLYYEGEVVWGHILHQLTIVNCDIENNVAMVRGGAFGFVSANVNITGSNIVNNFAPTYSTVYTTPSYPSNIDARGNYWGPNGPDDSVWNTENILFRDWLWDRVIWVDNFNPTPDPGSDDDETDPDDNPGSGSGPGWGPGSGSGFGFGTGTGPGLIGSGSGTGGSGSGSGSGTGGSGTGSGTGGSGTGSGGGGLTPGRSGGNSATPNGNTNSTVVWNDVGTVGLTAALGYASVGESGGSGSRGGSSGRAYELNEKDKTLNEDSNTLTGLLAVLFFMILVIAGYLLNNRRSNKL